MDAKSHFIFGYGSLISSSSRSLTGINGESIAVRVKGLQRFWARLQGVGMRAVGVRPDPDSSCNGVLFEVPESDLSKFDKREGPFCYKRTRLQKEDVELLSEFNKKGTSVLPENADFWVYVVLVPPGARESPPIAQSYLDVILSGCEELGRSFTVEFLASTLDWTNWHNDRQMDPPLYVRACVFDRNTLRAFDGLLESLHPVEFGRRLMRHPRDHELRRTFGLWHGYLPFQDLTTLLTRVSTRYGYLRGSVTQMHLGESGFPPAQAFFLQVIEFCAKYGIFDQIRHISLQCLREGCEILARFTNVSSLFIEKIEYTFDRNRFASFLSQFVSLRDISIGSMFHSEMSLACPGKTGLRSLVLREAPLLSRLELPPARISRVELGHSILNSSNIASFLRMHNQSLEHVSLCGSTRLKMLDLRGVHFPTLLTLDLRNCVNLKVLHLSACPKLRDVYLDQCIALETLEIQQISPQMNNIDATHLRKLVKMSIPLM